MRGIKHTVECTCMLPQFRHKYPAIFHKFIVFSIIDETDKLQADYAQCNNCDAVHKIIDVCKSEILSGQESLASTITVEDIKMMIPSDLTSILENYSCELPNWQHAHFIYDNKLWGEKLILVRELLEEEARGKILVFADFNKFKIESFTESLVIK